MVQQKIRILLSVQEHLCVDTDIYNTNACGYQCATMGCSMLQVGTNDFLLPLEMASQIAIVCLLIKVTPKSMERMENEKVQRVR